MIKKILLALLAIIVVAVVGVLAMGFLKPTYKGTVSVTVNAPAAKTFAVFNNTDNMGKWMNGFKGIENVSGEKNQVGSKWKLHFTENGREMVIDETVTEFEQDKHFGFDMEDAFAKFHVDVRFEEQNGQTVISQTSEGAGKGIIARSMIAIMSGSVQSQQNEMYGKLKTLVESQP